MYFNNVYFVLIRPQLGENIGACARAIKNFGFKNLRIVSPKQKWPNQKALVTSVGAKDIIKSAKLYKDMDKCIKDLDIIFATSSRHRSINKRTLPFFNLKKKIMKNNKIGFIFGPESSGLSNEDLSKADYLINIPTNYNFSSINLSHSVILFSFYLFNAFNKNKNSFKSSYKSKFATKGEVKKVTSFLISKLDKSGFLQPKHKRKSMINSIENIFFRCNLSEKETRILLGIFATLNTKNIKA